MTVTVDQATTDVEMRDVDSPIDENVEADPKDTDAGTIQDVRENIRQIERGVTTKESRFIIRILRSILTTRKELNSNILISIINGFFTHSLSEKEFMLSFFEEQIGVDSKSQKMRTIKNSACPLLPEVDAYIHLLIVLYLIDQGKFADAQKCSDALMEKLSLHSRRSLDLIQARCFFYHMRAYELNSDLDKCRTFFHTKLRTATLRSDFEGQAVLINCLLRSYLFSNLYDQADKLVSKSVFPENASNNEWARYLYYVGRIKAIRLEYSEAQTNLVQALRKAPQTTAVGFRQTVQKLLLTVELLLGDIPDRLIFREAAMRTALQPYFELTQAVRLGNLLTFSEVLNKFMTQFQEDHTFLMIIRLRHNVIKTGIRAIAASYSRITPAYIAKKLGLDSAQDAECILAKAIRDGVIEAIIDPINGYMQTKESTDIYSTAEPQIAFHKRTQFCLELHNQSVKAMRYPPKSYGKDLESAEERREREQQDLELAKEMAEDEDDGFP